MRQLVPFFAGAITALVSMASPFFGGDQHATAFSARASDLHVSADMRPAGIPRANDGLFYIRAGISSSEVQFLIDTGASHVILSHADARNVAATPISGGGPMIMTAAGMVKADWVTIDAMTVDGHVLRDVKAAVPHHDAGLSLLGQNALAQFTSVHINGDHIRFTR